MRKFKVIYQIGSEIFEEAVEAASFTCPENLVKFYVDERVVAIFKNMHAVIQVEGIMERTDIEKERDKQYKEKKNKPQEKEEDPFATFK